MKLDPRAATAHPHGLRETPVVKKSNRRRRRAGTNGDEPAAAHAPSHEAAARTSGADPFATQSVRPGRRPVARYGPWAVVLLVAAAAFAVRVVAARPLVFPRQGEVRLFDTDPYYHLRHARFVAAHFPRVQRLDTSVYPDGQRAFYAGLYDVGIAAAALIAGGGHTDDAGVERVAAWTPPVLGALVFIGLFVLGRATWGAGAGMLAAFLLLIYPGTFLQRSLLGFCDHHVAEALLAVLTVAGLGRGLQRAHLGSRSRWRPDILPALPLAIFFYTWFGAPIYVVLVALTFIVVVTTELARGDTAEDVARAATRFGLGFLLLVIPAALVARWLIMERRLFVASVLTFAVVAGALPPYARQVARLIASARERAPERRALPVLIALAGPVLGILVLALLAAIVPWVRLMLAQLIGVKTALVREQVSVTLSGYAWLGGAPGFLALAALPLAMREAGRARGQAALLAARAALGPVVLATLVVALWVRTSDYGYVAPAFLAFLCAGVVVRVLRGLRRVRARVAVAVVAGATFVLPVWPFAAVLPIVPGNALLRPLMPLTEGWVQTLRWMKAQTPALALPITAPAPEPPFHHPPGNYGVQAFWDFGHYIAAIAERPPLASGGISTPGAAWFLLTDEDQAVNALHALVHPGQEVRYCIADAQTAGDFFQSAITMAGLSQDNYVARYFPRKGANAHELYEFGEPYRKSMAARLYVEDGDGFAHFRLVYASPQRSALAYLERKNIGGWARLATVLDAETEPKWRAALASGVVQTPQGLVYDGVIGSSVKVFEIVAGAHLAGTTTPGATVEARLELHAQAGAYDLRYHRTTTADAAGRFDLLVAYPTEREPDGSDVVARDPYEVSAGAATVRVPVRAADVRTGAWVAARFAP
jgi:asparagine N-glycosylation enzyme membrane subunit Stt3